jgi:hypothetical protein
MHLLGMHIRCSLSAAVLALLPAAHGQTDVRQLQIPDVTGGASAEVIVRGRWGSAHGQFGKADDASRSGPMDFAATAETLYVLDPVNARVQLFDLDGTFRESIDISTRTADFMCVDADGNITVLDAFTRRELKTFSASGELLQQVRLPGSIGLCSAVFAEQGRVMIEERHSRVHELAALSQAPGAPARIAGTLPGRPCRASADCVHVRLDGIRAVNLRRAAEGQTDTNCRLEFPRRVAAITTLETDNAGRTYVAAACQRPGAGEWETDILLAVLDATGDLVGVARLPNSYATDHYRKICVSPGGDIIQMQTTSREVRFVRWTLGAAAAREVSR